MNALFIIGSVQAFFFSILIFTKTQKRLHDKILGLWLFFMGLQLLLKYINFNGLYIHIPWVLGLNAGFPLLHGPFLYLYINSLTKNYSNIRLIDFLHFIPFITIYIFLSPVLLLSNEAKIQIFIYGQNFDPKYLPLFLMILLSGPTYIVWSLYALKKHQENILKFFSYNEKVGLKWLYYLTIGLGVVWLAIIISYILTYAVEIVDISNRDIIIYIVLVIYVFVLGFKGFKQGSIFLNLNINKENENKQKINRPQESTGFKTKDSDVILKKLQAHMEMEKPYLEEKLSIAQLSESIQIPYYVLSQVINEKLNQNFFDFINTYRVDEAKEKLANPKLDHYSILGIALECGFNSKASFYRIFKNKTSRTPTQYKKEHKL